MPQPTEPWLPHMASVENGKLAGFGCYYRYAGCHFYPNCDCPTWDIENHLHEYGVGHEREYHETCWLRDWFSGGAVVYVGKDRDDLTESGIPADMNRTGSIKVVFNEEYVEWEWE